MNKLSYERKQLILEKLAEEEKTAVLELGAAAIALPILAVGALGYAGYRGLKAMYRLGKKVFGKGPRAAGAGSGPRASGSSGGGYRPPPGGGGPRRPRGGGFGSTDAGHISGLRGHNVRYNPNMSVGDFKKLRKDTLMKHHPDRGGNAGVFKTINNIFEDIRNTHVKFAAARRAAILEKLGR